MKNTLLSLVLLTLISFSCTQEIQKKQKSFFPGEEWLDTDGVAINAHEGSVFLHEDTYYWIGENKSKKRDYLSKTVAHIGFQIYSSKDLYNWENEGIALSVIDSAGHALRPGCIMERPKVIYNEKTQKFILWFHHEPIERGYTKGMAGLAISDTPTGPYKYIKSFNPHAGIWPTNYRDDLKEATFNATHSEWSLEWNHEVARGLFLHRDFQEGQMSHDIALFEENGKAYMFYGSENGQSMHIAELTDDYQDFTGNYKRIFAAHANTAQAVFKKDSTYFMIMGGYTSWAPNPGRLATADSIMGEWTSVHNPFDGLFSETSFDSKSTFIIDIDGKGEQFIYMGDRWNMENPQDSRYVWLPIDFENGLPIIRWHDEWVCKRPKLGQIKVKDKSYK